MKEMKPMVASSEAQAAVDRLLEAWRGDIQAGLVSRRLAERKKAPRRAGVIKAMAEAEAKHRSRIEERLRELGRPVPDPGTVRISPWLKLQARLAPLPRMLARMEAAEEQEITDRYKRPTGDPATDVLLSSIRHEEQQHSRQLKGMQAGGGGRADEMVSGPQARLDRILGRERWHRTGSGWVSGAIYGANDGRAAVFGVVSGVSGAPGGSSLVLTAGLAGAIASGLSMATGAFLAERSEAEVSAANVARERQGSDEEREELSLYYQLKGLDKETADMLAEKLSQDPDAMLKVLAAEELGGASEGGGHPVQAATAAGVSTFLGAMVPVLPFFFLRGTQGVLVAAVVSLVAHFLVGAAKSLFTLRTWWAAGLEMTLAGVLVGGATYAAGLLYVAR